MSIFKRTQRKYVKKAYRVRNWREYEAGLRNRGSLTVWISLTAGQLRRAPKSRDYRKLHLCVDEQTGEVVAGELTSKRARDSSRVASLVGQIDSPISSARADTAYDAGGVYEAIENHSAHRSPRVLIPPRKGALLASGLASSRQRNRNIAAQARLGKRKWHTESGYSKRSKVETTLGLLRFGGHLTNGEVYGCSDGGEKET